MENKKLGFGLMRLPTLDPNDPSKIDLDTMKKMVDVFLENGFTYFDTAWMYCRFQSECAVKEALVDRYPRDSFTLADKLNSGFIHCKEDRDKIFYEQLRKTGLQYFDYYLLHAITTASYEEHTKYDCFQWLAEKKRQGLVKHIGFSYHDSPDLLEVILNEHPEMEFVQLQLNYLDWDSAGIQSAKCYEIVTRHGLPVFVMEPVKGGTLAKVPSSVENLFRNYHPDMSVSSWAIRFAASLDNVKIVLSGMGSMDMMLDNISYMKDMKPLNEEEQKIVKEAVKLINESVEIPCTGCSYCTDGCPVNIAIPKYFSLYNADKQEIDEKSWRPQGSYYNNLTRSFGKASECVQCGQCEEMCPQHLKIREHLKTVADYFES